MRVDDVVRVFEELAIALFTFLNAGRAMALDESGHLRQQFFISERKIEIVVGARIKSFMPASSALRMPLISSTGIEAVRGSFFRRRHSSRPPTRGITTSLMTTSGPNEWASSAPSLHLRSRGDCVAFKFD